LCEWLLSSPNSQYARRACFLYERLTQNVLPIVDPVSDRASYVDAVDTRLQFARVPSEKWQRFRIINNLSGTPAYCPLVRKTPYLQGMIHKNLKGITGETLAEYDEALLRRTAAWLYLKETQSSFELECEKPSVSRAQRFADLLREADTGKPLNEDRLLELQHAVLDARFHEFTWRHSQNWLGDDLGYRQRVDFVPPRPDDVSALMQGLMDMAERESVRGTIEPVILAARLLWGAPPLSVKVCTFLCA
jgi:hypothetical protein